MPHSSPTAPEAAKSTDKPAVELTTAERLQAARDEERADALALLLRAFDEVKAGNMKAAREIAGHFADDGAASIELPADELAARIVSAGERQPIPVVRESAAVESASLELYGAADTYGAALRGIGKVRLTAAAVALKDSAIEYANRQFVESTPRGVIANGKLRGDDHPTHSGLINMLEHAICEIEAGRVAEGALFAALAVEKRLDPSKARMDLLVAPPECTFRPEDPRVLYVKSAVDRMIAANDPTALHRITQHLDFGGHDWCGEQLRQLFDGVIDASSDGYLDELVSTAAAMVEDHNSLARECERESAEKANAAPIAKQEAA